MNQKNRINSLDSLKAIAAFLVCYQHACGTGFLANSLLSIAKIAVPLFIMITGYMYKDTVAVKREKNQIKRYISIAVEMGVFWFIVDTLYHFLRHDLLFYWKKFIDLDNISRFLFFNDPVAADHAWYMWALIYVFVVLLVIPSLSQKRKLQTMMILLGFIAILSLGRYSFLFGKDYPYYFIRNFLCEGIPFFLVGMKIRQLDENKKIPNYKMNIGLVMNCIVLQILEFSLLEKIDPGVTSGIYIMTPFLGIAIFILCISLKEIVRESNILAVIGRKYSLFIYVVHPLFVRIEKKTINMESDWQYVGVVSVFVVSLLFAVVYSKTLKKTRLFRNVF